MFGMVYIVFWMSHLGLGWGILYSGWFKWYCGQQIWFWRTFHFWGRGIWWFRWYFWYFVWWLCDLGWLFGIWTVFTCVFGMLGNIFDIWEHPCCILDAVFFYDFLVFEMVHFWGPTVRGPICHFLRADSWAPDNWAPGPNCPGPNLPRTVADENSG